MQINHTILYHSADMDGLFSREIARKFLGDEGNCFVPWDHGDAPIPFPSEGMVYVLDLPPSCLEPFKDGNCGATMAELARFTWIDHHHSAIAKFPSNLAGLRIDGVSACRLTWQWFAAAEEKYQDARFLGWPKLEDFKTCKVQEPQAVLLAGIYDVHDTKSPLWDKAETFQHGLRSRELQPHDWNTLLRLSGAAAQDTLISSLMRDGALLQRARQNWYAEIIKLQGFDLQFEGLTFLACNSHELDIRSHLFSAGIKPHHEALCGFTYAGPSKGWRISLYHAPGHERHDLSTIAVKYGGGGHPGACGFHVKQLPFPGHGRLDCSLAQRSKFFKEFSKLGDLVCMVLAKQFPNPGEWPRQARP